MDSPAGGLLLAIVEQAAVETRLPEPPNSARRQCVEIHENTGFLPSCTFKERSGQDVLEIGAKDGPQRLTDTPSQQNASFWLIMACMARRKVFLGLLLLVGCLALGVVLYSLALMRGSAILADNAPGLPPLQTLAKPKIYRLDDVVSIQLERGACYGECPADVVVLHPDGTLEYDGGEYVSHLGKWTATFTPADFAGLVNFLNKNDFQSLDDEYTQNATDLATQKVTVRTKTGFKSVSEYGVTAPYPVGAARTAILKVVAGASNWTQISAPPKETSKNDGPPGDSN